MKDSFSYDGKDYDGKIYSNMRRRCLRRDDDTEFGVELTEDVTEFPEFVPSFDNWTSSEAQKRRARELDKMTDSP